MAQKVTEGTLLWEPSEEYKNTSNLVKYMKWLERNRNLKFEDYEKLWDWSVSDIEGFWESLWGFFDVKSNAPYLQVLSQRKMPGAKWFEGSTINYTEYLFRKKRGDVPAILSKSETRSLQTITWKSLEEQVAAFASALRAAGVTKGDRVVAYLPNIPEAVIAFLASASIGAIWSSCSPDFGSATVIDRFKQIQPKVLIAVDGYRYGGKDFDRLATVSDIVAAIPSLERSIMLPYLQLTPDVNKIKDYVLWDDFIKDHQGAALQFEQVSFDHPLWVLYSSGTTGLPKPIVQGQGGILLEHLKQCSLHINLKDDDRFFWFTTTGWMMWNLLVGGLLTGSAILLYDGNPGYPNLSSLWKFAEETGMTVFGTSASFLLSCMNNKIIPKKEANLEKLKSVGSTGSPLPPEGFLWVYENVKEDLWLASVSGGTDLCSAFVGGSPLLPVHAGEIQCRSLGAKVESFDEAGKALINEVGELVVTEPMPSMPVFFWNDEKGERYYNSYFDVYPGVWRHGDWIKITETGSCQIYGRSDSTINRGGIRIGTSEIYRAVERVVGVADSLVIDLSNEKGKAYMPLFVVLDESKTLNDSLRSKIKDNIRTSCSPRHVPDDILHIREVPRTLNGKKLEVPIKKILMGHPLENAINKGSISNPNSLDFFVEFSKHLPL
ncbi:acetoacetate--CoA ligase [Bacillus dakarensis]|uniref:acetoacetate--CoA ligase n=1 Tax=Robertmurraya dakarensis TaxID=1926278 RepID=UPI0009819631|nr:acetoacetate--CoA ligase [Bacillus dakarensis]